MTSHTSSIEKPAQKRAFLFATMAFKLLLFISLLTYNTGFSAEISVFVKTGDSVQLEIQTQKLPEFDDLCWIHNKSENIVKYINDSKKVKLHPAYNNRMDFNNETFSLTLKNMQKTDSGLYTARTSGLLNKNIAAYRVSVIDEVEAPVLTVNSNWSSPDPCSFTCKGSHIIISSIYNSSSCSPEEETSTDNYTLNLNCSDDHIMCNHSNPVSWKTDKKKANERCTVNHETPQAIQSSPYPTWFIFLICFLTTCLLASVIGWCLYKRKKDHYSPDQPNEQTVYEKVDNIKNIKPQQSPLETLEKSTKPCTLYDTVREHGPTDVTMETNEILPSHDSVNQSATPTENSKPNAPATIYCTIQKQPKSETDQTIYAVVNKQQAEDKSVHPKPE